jgi:hypothetical protein
MSGGGSLLYVGLNSWIPAQACAVPADDAPQVAEISGSGNRRISGFDKAEWPNDWREEI